MAVNAQTYFAANPDVAESYAQNSYGMTPDAFAEFHFKNFGAAESRGGSGVTTLQILDYLKASPGLSDAQIASSMKTYGISPAQMAEAVGLPVSEIQQRYDAVTKVTDYEGNKYDRDTILKLAKQITPSLDPNAIKGGVFSTSGESIGFNYDEATKLLGKAPTASEQVILDMARYLAKEGITDFSQVSATETNRRFGSTYTGGGGTIYEIRKDANGKPIISTWSRNTSDKKTILGGLALAALAFGIPGLTEGFLSSAPAGATLGSVGAEVAAGTFGGTAAGTGLGTGLTAGAGGLGLSTTGAGLGALGTGAGITAGAGLGTGVLAGSSLGTGLLGAGALTGAATLGGTTLGTAGTVAGMGTGTGITTAGAGGLGGGTTVAGLGTGVGTGLTTTGAGLGAAGTGAGITAGTGLTGTGVLTGSGLGSTLLGTTTGALTGTGVLTGSGLGTTLLGTGAGTGVTGALTTGVGTGTLGTGALTTGVGTGLGAGTATGLGGLTTSQLGSLLSGALTTGSGILQQQTSAAAAQRAQQMIDA